MSKPTDALSADDQYADCTACEYVDTGDGGDRYIVVMCAPCQEANERVIEAILARRAAEKESEER